METKIFGHNMRVEIVVLCLILGAFIGANLLCTCSGGIREGFDVGTKIVGAALDYSMGGDEQQKLVNDPNVDNTYNSWFSDLEGNTQGIMPPVPEGQLDLFAENISKPECCPSTYTTSVGCVCATPEQAKYLNERGGNRTLNSNY
tara:strand:- start:118 stop:552 length:435 start_codon:yes stop_codon:yes gene_type:complete